MKKITQIFLRGLFAVLPLAITLAILYWLGATAEAVLGGILQWLLPQGWYWRGMGVLFGVLVIMGVGILLNAYVFRKLGKWLDAVVERIPLVKTIYNSVRDIAQFAAGSQKERQLQKVVSITLDENIRLIGFVTRKSMQLGGTDNLVAVYFPMSYQIGGYTLFVPESRLESMDISVQDAMRMVLTAAITKPSETETQPRKI